MPWRCQDCGSQEHKHNACAECRAFPTLGFAVIDLIEANCVIPDGEFAGNPLILTNEQAKFVLNFYRLRPDLVEDDHGRWHTPEGKIPFLYGRGAQLVRPQKAGKGPFGCAIILAEAHPEGPVRFAGWDANGQAVGKSVPTPWIQCAAVSEDQTDNVWDALLPMIHLSDPLMSVMPDTGLGRINLPTGGKIEPVTTSGQSRLGQRITFALQDETHSWLENNQGWKVADTQRRNLAGTGGRFLETTNAWDPAENSVAQRTNESKAEGVFKDEAEPGAGSIRNKAERRRMLKKVYGDAATAPPGAPWVPWIDLNRIEGEIEALLEHDPPQAERYFLNRKLAGEGAAFNFDQWKTLATNHEVADGSAIVIGVDGARFSDALAMVATDVVTGHQWPLGIWETPQHAPDDYEHPFHEIDGAITEAWENFYVWRVYIDPQWIDYLVDKWQGRWGDKRVHPWWTNRPRQTAFACRNFATAINAEDLTHNGDELFGVHIRNARRRRVGVFDDDRRQMWILQKDRHDSPRKIDAAMAAVLSWEARGDAIAEGVTTGPEPLVAVVAR
jgi:hypothetical protein